MTIVRCCLQASPLALYSHAGEHIVNVTVTPTAEQHEIAIVQQTPERVARYELSTRRQSSRIGAGVETADAWPRFLPLFVLMMR